MFIFIYVIYNKHANVCLLVYMQFTINIQIYVYLRMCNL